MTLQEPYIDAYKNTKATHNWTVIYPSDHLRDEGASRSVILVNKKLNSNNWHQIHIPGKDVTGVQLSGEFGRITIFNIYNDCTNNYTLDALERYLVTNITNIRTSNTDHMLWMGDFNCHHPLWDEERNSHLFTRQATERALKLIRLLADYDMEMSLPKDIPTLESMVTKNWTRPDNTFASTNTQDYLVTCTTDPRKRGPGTDHVPILCTLELHIPKTLKEPGHDFRNVDWEEFRKELAIRLEAVPDPKILTSTEELYYAIEALTAALQETIEEVVPKAKPSPYSKRWWSRELDDLKRKKNSLSDLSYKLRALPDHPIHSEHTMIRNKYGEEIEKAKTQHWTEWLSNATERELWLANRYLTNPYGDGSTARIPTLVVKSSCGWEQDISTNEEKSKAFLSTFFPPPPAQENAAEDNTAYNSAVEDRGEIDLETLRRHLEKLSPYKAPGPDGIPNIILMRSSSLIETHLQFIFNGTLDLRAYHPTWKDSVTVVIRKPGKSDYRLTKAYRPIALLNTIAKLCSSIVAERIATLAERHNLLPAHHFGGRQGRTTTDALHCVTQKIKDSWRRGKVVSALFLDIEGAFPNAVTGRLVRNMRRRRIPRKYTTFVENLLRNRRTKLKFDDFTSDFFELSNGIGQGDPLSMILYLFYNADLLEIPSGQDEDAFAYVDDITLIAVADSFKDAHKKLKDMMKRAGGAEEWSRDHNSKWEISKFALMDFSQKRRADPLLPGKRTSLERPSLNLNGTEIIPSTSHRYLGVIFDQELRWHQQREAAVAKGAKWTYQFRRLARQSTGVSAKLMKRLYYAVAIPKMTYAADVWFTPIRAGPNRKQGSVGTVKKMATVQRIATLAITGALKSSATDTLDLHAFTLPISLMMDRICYRATIRMAAIAKPHPIHDIINKCTGRFIRRHRSPIYVLCDTYGIDPRKIEKVVRTSCLPEVDIPVHTYIAETRQEAITDDSEAREMLRIYADGSGCDGGIGAAAVLIRGDRLPKHIQYYLGTTEEHTVYEAEAVGITLAAELIKAERAGASSAAIAIDNQAVIYAVRNRRSHPGQYIFERFQKQVEELRTKLGATFAISLRWISGHEGVEGNEMADLKAKEAARGKSSPKRRLPAYLRHKNLPISASASKQKFNEVLAERWATAWRASKRYAKLNNLDPSLPSRAFIKLTDKLNRTQHSLLVQLRTGHIGLNMHLHRIGCVDDPTCPACKASEETVHHLIFECPAYQHERHQLRATLRRGANSLRLMVTNPKAALKLLSFLNATGRLKNSFGEVN